MNKSPLDKIVTLAMLDRRQNETREDIVWHVAHMLHYQGEAATTQEIYAAIEAAETKGKENEP